MLKKKITFYTDFFFYKNLHNSKLFRNFALSIRKRKFKLNLKRKSYGTKEK